MISRSDLRDARCSECDARCIPGQSHLEHNAGWKKMVLSWDWYEITLDDYPNWDLVDSGNGEAKHPPFVKLTIRNKIDKGSREISQELDDIVTGRFYYRDWTRDGSCFVRDGEIYDAGWWFQKREDAYMFVKTYGGITE